jgi:hypothetical protein
MTLIDKIKADLKKRAETKAKRMLLKTFATPQQNSSVKLDVDAAG